MITFPLGDLLLGLLFVALIVYLVVRIGIDRFRAWLHREDA